MSKARHNVYKLGQIAIPEGIDTTGVIDSSPTINATIDELHARGGGTLVLPHGTIKANITLKPGVIVQGQGRGSNADGIAGAPQPPVYTATGGGTTITYADPSKPVIQATGGGDSSTWGEFTIRDLKIAGMAGAIFPGTIGIRATLAQEITLQNIEVAVIDTGIQLGASGATAWSFKIDGCSIHDCGAYGLLIPDKTQTGTPCLVIGTDIRRCTGTGAYIRDVCSMTWIGGTVADNAVGMEILGDITRGVSVFGVEFEAQTSRAVVIGASGQAPQAVTFQKCGFTLYGASPVAGTVAIEQISGNANQIIDCSFRGYATCLVRIGGVTPIVIRPFLEAGSVLGAGMTTLNVAATDAASTQALVNQIRSLLIAQGHAL